MKEKISPAEISTSPLPPKSRYLRKRRFDMLAQWYGQERAEREITAHTAEPQSIGVLLDNILVKIRRPENGVLIKVFKTLPFFDNTPIYCANAWNAKNRNLKVGVPSLTFGGANVEKI